MNKTRTQKPQLRRFGRSLIISAAALFLMGFPSVGVNPGPAYVYPLMATRVSSDYGRRIHPIRRFSHHHTGIDLAAPFGTPIRAVAAGRVIYSDPHGGYGNFVVIKHKNRVTTHYGHCQQLKVKAGQAVKAGQIIATVGSTGVSTGPHLHFEIRVAGVPKDPENYIPDIASHGEG